MKTKARKKMNKKELKVFKELLLKKKEKIVEGIEHVSADSLKKSQKEASGDISSYTYHMADVATDNYDREFSLTLGGAEREMLYKVTEALRRIEDATYGICEDCLKLIAKTRLKAVPHAKLCVKCQETKEEK
ncbi:MAG TPA: TraR/DksA family transcriptional regulator [Candidatus Omnitrophica bacterium]|nr:TraR/DksA family transcriptional regulator [Candidatus Omnitrophota bacterium]